LGVPAVHPPSMDGAVEDLPGVGEPERDRFGPNVLQPYGDPAVGEELCDPAAHDAGAEDADALDRTGVGRGARLLRVLHQVEDVDQVLRYVGGDEPGDGRGL